MGVAEAPDTAELYSEHELETGSDRIMVSGDEAGTPPDDRPFRPDIQGLRAVAVGLVVLFHAQLGLVPGGYVGVDVFFVVSGFVITGLLLREQGATKGTSLLDFYARRARRILPAATLVILATVVASYVLLGLIRGNEIADDGRWAAVFLSNFHSIWTQTNYFGAQQQTSPLVHYWSLSVEEQFYLVFPALFLVVTKVGAARHLRLRLSTLLGLVIVASVVFSITETHAAPVAAYFSFFTRAGELALGCLIAVLGPHWHRIPKRWAMALGWTGVAGIITAALAYSSSTPYPGIAVALPVLSTAAVIVAGFPAPSAGPEWLLGRWLALEIGAISFSLYLWHFPVLLIPEQHAGHQLSLLIRLGLIAASVVLAYATYRLLENPVRHAGLLRGRRLLSIGLGLLLVAVAVVVPSVMIRAHSSHATAKAGLAHATAAQPQLHKQIMAGLSLDSVPAVLIPPLPDIATSPLAPLLPPACHGDDGTSILPSCIFGDTRSKTSIVLYGDSQAEMWSSPFIAMASQHHLKIYVLEKGGCGPWLKEYYSSSGGWFTDCDTWHRWATQYMISLKPATIFITGYMGITQQPGDVTQAATAMISSLRPTGAQLRILSNVPWFTDAPLPWPPDCLAQNVNELKRCTLAVSSFQTGGSGEFRQTLSAAAAEAKVPFIVLDRLFCSSTACPMVVNHRAVYENFFHITSAYASYVEPALDQLLSPLLPRAASGGR
jgi:peptidoglycan/LPS O-acetylase OafA/YrhL